MIVLECGAKVAFFYLYRASGFVWASDDDGLDANAFLFELERTLMPTP